MKWIFYILNGISDNVTLVKLMDTLVNVNRAISKVGYWIFDFNYEKALCLKNNHWIWYAFFPLVKKKLQNLNQYFTPLDTCGHQLIIKLDKYEDTSKMTIHQKNEQNKETNYIYI